MERVLIIGLGSIGQRHANALINIGIKNIAALRTLQGNKEVDAQLNETIKMFYSEKEAFEWAPTHLVISNPSSLHLKYIQIALEKKIKFFVEKPIDESYEKLTTFINRNIETKGYVGYILRFHGVFQFLKKLIEDEKYGKVITANLHVGQYLPNWHPYEDYRNGYYSKKLLGGGALRTLSHEIDLAQFLFGKYLAVYSKVNHLSSLEIDVDDVTTIIAENEKCKMVNIHINFLDPAIIRKGTIYFTEGVVEYNWVEKTVTFISNDVKNSILIYKTDEEYDLQYRLQMQHFISNTHSSIACSFEEGLEVMKIIEACELSNLSKKEICLV